MLGRSNPRRLLTIGHSYVVGVNRRLVTELARTGAGEWEVTALAPSYFHGTRDLRPQTLSAAEEGLGDYDLIPARAHLSSRVHVFLYGRALRRALRARWDLVHCWEEPFVLAGGQVALWARPRTPLVYYTFQNLSKRYPPPFRWIERAALRRAAGWIAAGNLVEDTLRDRAGYADRPRRTIPLGVDVDLFRPDPARRSAALRELQWDDAGPPVVGFLGRFVEEKGVRLLMRALETLRTPWRALLIGAGPLEGELRAWSRQRSRDVRLLTGVSHAEVPRYLNAMDCLAAPSLTTTAWREQLGRMLLEAFASGVPAVGSDSGEIPHVIGDAGVVAPEADERALCEAIGRLLDSPALREDLAARGRARALECFAWPVIARRHLEFFEELLAQRGLAARAAQDE